jgi:glycerate 2-kinase
VQAALRACDPEALVSRAVAREGVELGSGIVVVAAGKAASPMANAFAKLHEGAVAEILIARGSHPVPDGASVEAALRALRLAREVSAGGGRLVVLLSGGASAMMAAPADTLTLEDKIAATRALLASGLAIGELNAVRKHLSAIKGGQLGAAAGRSITYAISDVHAPIEDDPATIGSGPTVADPTTFADAERALRSADLLDAVPTGVRERIARGVRGEVSETIKPGDPRLARARFVLAGSRRDAMDGACGEAASRGYALVRVAAPTIGSAVDAASTFVELVRREAADRPRPICVVASGETTVRVSSDAGVGGRNQEFALAAVRALESLAPCVLASVGTDGIDGPTDAAGALADSSTLARARALGLDADAALRRHDSHPFFRALGDLIVTGPTGTNVGDLQVLLLGSGL